VGPRDQAACQYNSLGPQSGYSRAGCRIKKLRKTGVKSSRLYRFSLLLVVFTLLLLMAGASVTSNDAGLSVPDWPLSYGQWMPPMRGGVLYEHGHRMIAASVGLLTVILAVALTLSREPGWLKRLGWVAVGLVVLQGLFGGLTVLMRLPAAVSITHAMTAHLFFTLLASIALFLSPGWKLGPEPVIDEGSPSLRSVAPWVPAAVLAQIGLGAAYRHHVWGLVPHVVGALVVSGLALLLGAFLLQQFPAHRSLRGWASRLITVSLLQLVLGIAAYLSRIYTAESPRPEPLMVLFTVLHVAGGGLMLAASTLVAIEVRRHVRQAPAAAGAAGAPTSP